MTDRPPPFSALRAVEAASRHRSFTWAAKELQITHSAVSQSIRRLEADLGTTLFERKGGAMEPSEAALRLAETYSEAALSLDRTLRAISGGQGGALVVTMPGDLGRLWFGGKLSRLGEAVPDIRIDIRTGPDRTTGPGDIAIDFTADPALPVDDIVADLGAFPVCSPDLFAGRPPERARDLIRHPLIAGGGLDWSTWAAHFDVPVRKPASAFDDTAMALEAAVQGAGVALTHLFAAESHLEAGRLVALPFQAPTGRRLSLSIRAQGQRGELAARFGMWFRLEVARSMALNGRQRRPEER
jgi:DNA-binding transcriptional LysR family regulator